MSGALRLIDVREDAGMNDESIVRRVGSLIDEEHRLYGKLDVYGEERTRLKAIEVELDQCWDLLRQRRARREFGENPDEATVRSPDIVEHYSR